LTNEGTTLVIGALGWDGAWTNMGGVYTYNYNSITLEWDQYGDVLTTSGSSYFFGFSLAVSQAL